MATYDAFVSYSHAKDKPIAAALQSVVQKLGKPWYRRRALRVFRDDTSLSATPSLWPSIEQALGQSRYLILLASPEAAASPWVSKEVAYWLDHKGADRLLIAVTGGALVWDNSVADFTWREGMPLPPVLTGRFASEPKWVDLSAYRDGANPRDAKLTELAADFAAAIHGMPKEDLLSQELRQQRRALTLAWSAAVTLLVFASVAGWQWWEADGAKRTALAAEQVATEQKGVAQMQRDLAVRNFGIAKNAADHVVFRIAQDLRNVQGMRVESVRQILDTAQVMMDELVRAAPDDPALQRSRGLMLTEFATTYSKAGDPERARAAGDQSLAILRKLSEERPDDAGRQADLGHTLYWVSEVYGNAGDGVTALARMEESLAIRRKLAMRDPANGDRQRDVIVSLSRIGDLRLEAEDLTAALAAYEEALAIARKLVATAPDNAVWARDVALGLKRISDVRSLRGDLAGAVAVIEESLAIMRKATAAEPGNAQWQRDLSLILINLGDLRRKEGDEAAALAAYEESLSIARRVAAADPGSTFAQLDVMDSLEKIGDARLAAADHPGALAAYEESLSIARKLAASDPGDIGWQVKVSESLRNVGDVRLAAKDHAAALAAYEESLAIMRKATARDPESRSWQHGLTTALVKVGEARLAGGDRATARAAYKEGLAILRKLVAADPMRADWQVDLVTALRQASLASDEVEARALLIEALAAVEALARDGKLTRDQQNWPQLIREALANLPPPERAEAR
jgi:tetratricopeptide (TPR) repeat protein